MEKLGDYVKQSVLNFKLELCCFMASVRTGILILACANIILGFITQVALADKTFKPILLQALNGLSETEDEEPKTNFQPLCIIAYAVELASNSLLLCGILRNDLVLLRVYLYYCFGVITAAVMVYSVVFFSLSISLEILILASVLYQLYLILLVRSVMVEIKEKSIKNGYVVNLKRNDDDPSGPGPRETYSIVIEPEKVKKTPITIVKEDWRKPVGKDTVKPDLNKEATLPVHLATREVIVKPVPVKEVTVPEPVKITVPIQEPKGTKAEVKEVAKEKEVKKPSRSFFGKKEKVKIEEKAKLEKIEEAKKD